MIYKLIRTGVFIPLEQLHPFFEKYLPLSHALKTVDNDEKWAVDIYTLLFP